MSAPKAQCPVCFRDSVRVPCELCAMAGIWNLSAIVAMTKDGVIAVGGRMPWKCSQDMARFRALTLDHNNGKGLPFHAQGKRVIMGRKTWDSLPVAPLAGRANVVLTSRPENLAGALFDQNPDNLHYGVVIGGAQVYRQFLPRCKYLFLTTIPDAMVQDTSGERTLFPMEYLSEFPHVIASETVDVVHYQTLRNRTR